jgi:flagellar protein FlgJ
VSIDPSTDIILEVARAADPARATAVAERLNALSRQGAASPQDFAAALDASAPLPAAVEAAPDLRARLTDATLGRNRRADEVPKKLESLVLTEFIGEMLPKDTPSAYGKGFAGDMWRSLLAERVADQMAASGRVGIASRLFAGRPLSRSAELLAPNRPHGLGEANATQASANPLSAPSDVAIERGAVLFAKAQKS